MVPLPLFKLGSLFIRHISKYGANTIKAQAHDHPRFRALAARYGQWIHQWNMRLSVALLRDPDRERRAKERAEAPTVKTEEQHLRDEEQKQKEKLKEKNGEEQPSSKKRPGIQNIWRRKFRHLPEAKAVDLFADVIGDTFILTVAGGLIMYEYWKAQQKPDANKERIEQLSQRFDELREKEQELLDREKRQAERFETLEAALRELRDPKTKKPMLPTLQPSPT